MRTHLIHPHTCPHCGHKMTVIGQLDIGSKKNKLEIDKNCISFCARCHEMFCFNDDGNAIKVPDEDMKNLEKEGLLDQLNDIRLQLIQAKFKV
jgi:cytochrome c553